MKAYEGLKAWSLLFDLNVYMHDVINVFLFLQIKHSLFFACPILVCKENMNMYNLIQIWNHQNKNKKMNMFIHKDKNKSKINFIESSQKNKSLRVTS
jgi:hypothetical protein